MHDVERGYARFRVAFEEELDEAMSEEAFACVFETAGQFCCERGWI